MNQPAQAPSPLQRHEFVIHDVHTEGGATLPEAHVVYTTMAGAAHARAATIPGERV